MKREHFLRTIASIAGGLTVVGCSSDLISELIDLEPDSGGDISIEEAEKWFNQVYLQKNSAARKNKNKGTYQRQAAWNRAQKPKNARNKKIHLGPTLL